MNCNKCGAELDIGAAFCPDCGAAVASVASEVSEASEASEASEVSEAPEASEASELSAASEASVASELSEASAEPKASAVAASSKNGKTLREVVSGPLGIVVAVLLCLWSALSVFSLLFMGTEGSIMVAGAIALDLVPAAFGIVAAVAMWKIVATKDIGRDKLAHVSKFYGVLRIFATITFVAGCIACGGIYIGVILFGALFDVGSTDLDDVGESIGGSIGEMLDWLDYEIGSSAFGMFLFGSIITAAVIFYLYHWMRMHRDIKDYYDRITAVGEGRAYNAALKAPRISLFVMAGINLAFNVLSLLFGGGIFAFITALLMQALLVVTGVMFTFAERAILSGNGADVAPESAEDEAPAAQPAADAAEGAAPTAEPVAENESSAAEPAVDSAAAAPEIAAPKPAMSQAQMMLMMQIMMKMQAQQKAAASAAAAVATEAAPVSEPAPVASAEVKDEVVEEAPVAAAKTEPTEVKPIEKAPEKAPIKAAPAAPAKPQGPASRLQRMHPREF